MVDYISETLKNLKLINHNRREDYIYKLLDYYNGGHTSQYIEKAFDADAFREIPPYEANITKRFINKMSRIYTQGAKRNVSKKYSSLTLLKDTRMKSIERMTRLVGSVANRIMWNEESQIFDYRPVYFFHPFFGDDPFTPSAISYPLIQSPDEVSNINNLEYIIWDSNGFTVIDSEGNIIKEGKHGYGVLPFVFTHREVQTDSFFVDGANDLISANEHINIAMTEMQLGLRFQMFGQPVATGVELGNKQRFGSDVTLELPEGATYNIVAPQGNVQEVIDNIKFQVELVAQNNHMWVQWSESGGEVPSGISLMIKDLEYHHDFVDDIAMWKMYEQEFYQVEKAIASSRGISLPEKFGIDFEETEYPKSVQDQIMWDKHRLEMNLISEADLLVEYNKDLTTEEAEKIIAENKSKNKELSIFERARQEAQETPRL
tara:strand:+ start:1585 stop:2880 length:1296 start_codon:yes stop_codon:yes gene_type:complete